MSENKEFYRQTAISEEEIKRLKQIDYPNHASEALLTDYDLKDRKVLDAGAGPNDKLAAFITKKGGTYIPADIRGDVLKNMRASLQEQNLPFLGVQADASQLPFSDNAFDITHQRFVFMNVASEKHAPILAELTRVTKEDMLLLEYNWETLHSTNDPETIERFRQIAFTIFSRFSTDPYMGQKLPTLLNQSPTPLRYTIRHFQRSENKTNSNELLQVLPGFHSAALNMLKDEKLAQSIAELIEQLKTKPINFTPPEIIAAVAKKKN
ncbi:MAG: methyltransferase domain-containing protein [Candidatus Andersenbacteria bacterium]|nr:methyltransferase domain-containing protein [bacterium]MDZ4225531.1 methyltransferase domain-containing protein [Candidatus Andersenbacteria bacterium]